MSERKVSITTPDGKTVTGIEVDIDEAIERWSDVKLSDGTVFRAKINVFSVVRVEGEFDASGNPTYIINAAPVMAVTSARQELRKPE